MLTLSTHWRKFLIAWATLILCGCAAPTPDSGSRESVAPTAANFNPAANGLRIVVSIPPQKYWLESIVGEYAQVVSLTSPYDDVTSPTFTPENVDALNSADLFVRIGLPFERKLAVPSSCRTVSMLKDTKLKAISTHVNKLNPEDKFTGADHYIWMAPSRVVRMLVPVYEQLHDLDADHTDQYNTNFTRLTRDLNSIEGDVNRILIDKLSENIFVQKPVLGYFCEDFGLKQFSANVSDGDTTKIIGAALEQKIRVILLTSGAGMLDPRAPQLLAGTAATINPLQENYAENLRNIARAITGRSANVD